MQDEQVTVRSVITPNDQLLRDVFSSPRAYYIDIYQREYRWTEYNVHTLLNDIEAQFGLNARTKSDPKEIQKDVLKNFEPYFLNTYLTHSTEANRSIVDGQQRLTTFLLIFIKLCKILKQVQKDADAYKDKTFASQTLEKLIFESNDFGEAGRFKIYNENRESAFRSLIEDAEIEPVDETQDRIKKNYRIISDYYDRFFSIKDMPGRYDLIKLTYYITYLLDRTSIVEIKIEKQKNVAMIFEVVNDRGEGLRPYEILKGKLIGNLPVEQKEAANEVWTQLQDSYFNATLRHSTDSKLDLDMFFQTYFRAKFADSENDYERFEGKYHYQVYGDQKIRNYFRDFTDTELLFHRVVDDIAYYARTYLRLRTTYENNYLIYNKLLDQNQQYLLILANLEVNDPQEKSKVNAIAKEFDRFHAIIRLLNAYESNSFQRLMYPLNREIRGKSPTQVAGVFDNTCIHFLEDTEVIPQGRITTINDVFTYDRFKGVSNRWLNFSKYILLRIDRYLAELLDKPSYAAAPLEDLEERFNKRTTKKYGMHLEHIYAFNPSNMSQFTNDKKEFDENAFMLEREKLGMLLLLKDKQNISSNNEVYRDKLNTYKTSNIIWNELLAGHLPSVDLPSLPADLHTDVISPTNTGAFPRDRVEQRQKLTFNAIKRIWG